VKKTKEKLFIFQKIYKIFMDELRPISSNPNLKIHKLPLALDQKMKTAIEIEAKNLGISEQGFIRLAVSFLIKKHLTPEQIINNEE
jgi:hypothetical protein